MVYYRINFFSQPVEEMSSNEKVLVFGLQFQNLFLPLSLFPGDITNSPIMDESSNRSGSGNHHRFLPSSWL